MNDREERIRRRAYEIWQREGSPHGRHDDHWLAACREIDAQDRSRADQQDETRNETVDETGMTPRPSGPVVPDNGADASLSEAAAALRTADRKKKDGHAATPRARKSAAKPTADKPAGDKSAGNKADKGKAAKSKAGGAKPPAVKKADTPAKPRDRRASGEG